MKDWKKRVKKEKEELDEKLGNLSFFIEGALFEALPSESKLLLYAQETHMKAYSEVLGKRVNSDA